MPGRHAQRQRRRGYLVFRSCQWPPKLDTAFRAQHLHLHPRMTLRLTPNRSRRPPPPSDTDIHDCFEKNEPVIFDNVRYLIGKDGVA